MVVDLCTTFNESLGPKGVRVCIDDRSQVHLNGEQALNYWLAQMRRCPIGGAPL